ncbi:hypothetical protein CC117_21840 [Parafrankia colletiae]|uniref:Integral membrane protein n=1 Tax=Parafrankia colletiae TaxID=573497 RepID=A0A1S1QPL6_9ACTN|nr:hypothetical protein [Parafrankia colletiae]MCK9899913.1 hypothetical protein [Frankia sp. Cpl3]OHV34274.1 hypothetical protein CC117_21840 [Parafrankia colletiae]
MEWSWLTGSYHEQIVRTGREPLLLLLLGLVGGFLFIRTSARLIRANVRWWPGNVSAGGVHLHHEFFGVLMVLTTGTISFATDTTGPWRDVLALVFGIGAGLVLDEFALLLHLKDVYWTREGRSSVDAVIVATALTGLLLLRVAPFGLDNISGDERLTRWTVVAFVLVNLALTMLTALKGKPWLALFSVFATVIGVWGVTRLAAPRSPWARRTYDERKLARAGERAARWNRRRERVFALIAGADSPGPPDSRGSPT